VGVNGFLSLARAWVLGGDGELRAHASQPTMQMLRSRIGCPIPSAVSTSENPRRVRVLVDDDIADGVVVIEALGGDPVTMPTRH
jgi:hypothetical protein